MIATLALALSLQWMDMPKRPVCPVSAQTAQRYLKDLRSWRVLRPPVSAISAEPNYVLIQRLMTVSSAGLTQMLASEKTARDVQEELDEAFARRLDVDPVGVKLASGSVQSVALAVVQTASSAQPIPLGGRLAKAKKKGFRNDDRILRAGLKNRDAIVREEAALGLGYLGDRIARDELYRIVHAKAPGFEAERRQAQAVAGLIIIGEGQNHKEFRALMSDPGSRSFGVMALGRRKDLAARRENFALAIDPHMDHDIRERAMENLVALRDPNVTRALESGLKSSSADLRGIAAMAAIKRGYSDLVPALRASLEVPVDTNAPTADAAARYLAQIAIDRLRVSPHPLDKRDFMAIRFSNPILSRLPGWERVASMD